MDTHPVLTSHVIHCSQIQKLSLSGKVRRSPRGSRKEVKKEREKCGKLEEKKTRNGAYEARNTQK
jgi:hypothetical protein